MGDYKPSLADFTYLLIYSSKHSFHKHLLSNSYARNYLGI